MLASWLLLIVASQFKHYFLRATQSSHPVCPSTQKLPFVSLYLDFAQGVCLIFIWFFMDLPSLPTRKNVDSRGARIVPLLTDCHVSSTKQMVWERECGWIEYMASMQRLLWLFLVRTNSRGFSLGRGIKVVCQCVPKYCPKPKVAFFLLKFYLLWVHFGRNQNKQQKVFSPRVLTLVWYTLVEMTKTKQNLKTRHSKQVCVLAEWFFLGGDVWKGRP